MWVKPLLPWSWAINPNSPPPSMVHCEQVSYAYRHGHPVVSDFSASFEPGLSLLVGYSGCGKSTLLKLIAGFLKPSQGRILVDGKNPRNAQLRRDAIGFVFQQLNLLPLLSIRQNLQMAAALSSLSRSEIRDSTETLLCELGLEPLAKRRPIYGYSDSQFAALQRLFPEITEPGAFLIDPTIPSGTRVHALIADLDLNLHAIRESSFGLNALGTESLALLPSAWIPWLQESGFAEIVIYQSPYENPTDLEAELARLNTLLQLEGLDDVEIRSGFALLQRLESIRQQHAVWSLLIEFFVGLLIVFVFASTGFLEYRQNAYLSALLQSLGVARALLALRDLGENLILLFAAFATAFALIALAMNGQLPFLPLPQSSLGPLAMGSLQSTAQAWSPLILVTAIASFIPIGLGLRREVGSILQ